MIAVLNVASNVKVQEHSHNMSIGFAISQLENLCESIQKQSITLESLTYVRSKRMELKKLCDAVNSGKKKICSTTYAELEPHLNGCFAIAAEYLDYRRKVSTLLEFCEKYYGMLNI